MTKYGVFIDCQMASNAMAYIAREMGVIPIHVYSSYEKFQTSIKSLNSMVYEHHIISFGDDDLLRQLEPYKGKIAFVIPGADSGVGLRVFLQENLLGQKHPYAKLQQDRMLLALAIGSEAYAVGSEIPHDTPYTQWVSKPRVSHGGIDRVSILPLPLAQRFDDPEFFLVPFYKGTEYSVDVVSFDGLHCLNAVWAYVKYYEQPLKRQHTELVLPNDPVVDRIRQFVFSVLSRVQFKTGATHTEVIVDQHGIVQLVEVNFRTQGQMSLRGLRTALVIDQPTETVHAELGLPPRTKNTKVYETKAHLIRYNLFNNRPRRFSDVKWAAIEALPTFAGIFYHFTPHDHLPVSDHTLRSMTAKVIFASKDCEQIQVDIRNASGLFND